MSAYDELLRLCQARSSCRSFRPDPVPADALERIVAVARTAPYASGRKSWDIVAVTARERIDLMAAAVRRRIDELATGLAADARSDFAAYAASFVAFERAPAVFVLSFRSAPSLSLMVPDPAVRAWEHESLVKSISCPAMLVLLAAASLGLGTCYMTGPLLAGPNLDAAAGVRNGRTIGALVPVGYPEGEAP